ncbi:MAG: PQQ-binding-like beta-propeller repeat protein [Planctomycetota bacterium]
MKILRITGLLAGLIALMLGMSHAQEAKPVAGSAEHSDWPSFRGDREQSGVAGGRLTEKPVLLWTYATEAAIASSPVVEGGRVFVGSDDYHVHAIDLETGKGLWKFPTDDMIEAPPLVHGDTVYVGSTDVFFYALDKATGKLRWKFETGDKIQGGATWFQSGEDLRIVFGSYDASLYCLDAKTGELVWQYETENYVNGTPAVWDDHVVFGGCDARLHVVDMKTGKAKQQLDMGAECHIAGSVGISKGQAFFGHYGNEFVRVDLATGEVKWHYGDGRNPYFSAPSIRGDRVIFGGRDKMLHSVDFETGEPQWTFKTRRKIDASPILCGDLVAFGSADGRLYLLDVKTGESRWTYDIGQSIFSSPAVAAGRLLIGANDGLLYAFGAAELQPDQKGR